jgi:integrase
MSGPIWTYRPASHKNKHRGLDRVIFLGPQAQEVIKPFLTTNLEAYLFSPRAYVDAMHRRRAEQRKTKRTPSELKRCRKPKPRRVPAERYNRRSYRVAIIRACQKAKVPEWSPLQLRHTAATAIRAKYGVEAAKVILGHTKVETTQIYAERDLDKAQKIMGEIG